MSNDSGAWHEKTSVIRMGLLRMLAFPITGPLWVAGIVRDEAERRLYDVDAIRAQADELAEQYEAGWISREFFEHEEEYLLQRLMDARAYHRQRQLED